MPTSSDAIALAELGWAVGPIRPKGKAPLTSHGVKDFTKDKGEIERYWRRYPNANIGIATGTASGIYVLDIDVKDGAPGWESLAELERQGCDLPEPGRTAMVATPSGGAHIYFLLEEGEILTNTAGKVGPGLDTRGEGGYVVAPPSELDAGNYSWAEESLEALVTWGPACLLSVPAWLSSRVSVPSPVTPIPVSPSARSDRVSASPARFDALLDKVCASVASAPSGTRNDTLNRAAFYLAKFLPEGLLLETMWARLISAAMQGGLSEREAVRTLESAIPHGARA
ncbi:MAG: bifunctional DNA primase/polymerase [Ferrimicrobium sp.]